MTRKNRFERNGKSDRIFRSFVCLKGGFMRRKGWLRHLDFISIDILAIECSLALTYLIDILLFSHEAITMWHLCLLLPFLHLALAILSDAYNGILQRGYLKETKAVLRIGFFDASVLLFVFYFLDFLPNLAKVDFVLYFCIFLPMVYILRFLQKFYLRHRYNNMKYSRQILVAATEAAAREMIHTITGSAIRNYQFFGLAVLDRSMIGERIEHVTVSADHETLVDYVKEHVIDEVLLNVPDRSQENLLLARELLEMGVTVHIYMEAAYDALPNRSISNIFGYNVLTTSISPISFKQSLGKRFMDIMGGITGCLITLLLTIVIGPMIFLKSPGPIFFSQIRIGKNGRQFKIYKFRSMYMDAEERKKELMEKNKIKDGLMFKMDDDPRIIKGIGNFIRKTSLDEFPQFFNVLKGDMSVVGTRPPTADEYARYSPHHKRRLTMLPGVTGLWQVSGRSKITDFEEVVRLDTEYIENWSLSLDIKIILKTVTTMIRPNGAS